MLKKLGLLALAVVFLLTSAVTGTLAFEVNAASAYSEAQSSGSGVEIQNIIAKRGTALTTLAAPTANTKLVSEDEPLYVAVYGNGFNWETSTETFSWGDGQTSQLWTGISNAMDRFTFVENVGGQSCYVRTIFALEADTTGFNGTLIHVNKNETDYTWTTIPGVTIDGVTYDLYVATYQKELAPNSRTAPSLLQIAMDSKAGNQEVMQFGDKYDVLIWSQAVETTGYTDAETALNEVFGAIDLDHTPWQKAAQES